MKIEGMLGRDEALRLECLRLAVEAGYPALCGAFYDFVAEGKRIGSQPTSDATQEVGVDQQEVTVTGTVSFGSQF